MKQIFNTISALAALILLILVAATHTYAASEGCRAQKDDVAGCQPGPFTAPLAEIPNSRVDANGKIDEKASDADTKKGVKVIQRKLGLFRNFEDLFWIPLDASKVDPATGKKSGGDLDGEGDGRGLTIAGKCLFGGHWNVPRKYIGGIGTAGGQDSGQASEAEAKKNGTLSANPIDVLRIQDDPFKGPPVAVSSIAADPGYDDTMLSAAVITNAKGVDQIILMRDSDSAVGKGDGRMHLYTLDPATCKVISASEPYMFGGDFHEPGAWIDPRNPKRMLIVASTMSWNSPDTQAPDLRIMAITDETTGEMLPKPLNLATFRLQDVGGPVTHERPDSTGLFSDGRFADFSKAKNTDGSPISTTKIEENGIHQATMSGDGERIYAAGASAGFYILNAEAIAHNSNAQLISGEAKCNTNSTNIYVDKVIGGNIDAAKIAEVSDDCVHLPLNDDPGVKALVKAGKVGAYLALQDRSRWDPFPPRPVHTGTHSAIVVPDRPSIDIHNLNQKRPSLAVVTEERFDCPFGSLSLIQVDSEITPQEIGTFGLMANTLDSCAAAPRNRDNRRPSMHFSHDPTVFKNLVFVAWMSEGLRAIDISNARNPREVGYAVPAPSGLARSYPVYKDGLFYWMDINTGIHVVRYTGPRADELPRDGLVYEGNSTPHR